MIPRNKTQNIITRCRLADLRARNSNCNKSPSNSQCQSTKPWRVPKRESSHYITSNNSNCDTSRAEYENKVETVYFDESHWQNVFLILEYNMRIINRTKFYFIFQSFLTYSITPHIYSYITLYTKYIGRILLVERIFSVTMTKIIMTSFKIQTGLQLSRGRFLQLLGYCLYTTYIRSIHIEFVIL